MLVVFSIDTVAKPSTASDRAFILNQFLPSIGVTGRASVGIYKGQREHSFMAQIENHTQHEELFTLLKKYQQESVLFIGNSGLAVLHYVTGPKAGEILNLGQWAEIETMDQDCTLDLDTLKIYTVKVA